MTKGNPEDNQVVEIASNDVFKETMAMIIVFPRGGWQLRGIE